MILETQTRDHALRLQHNASQNSKPKRKEQRL